MLFLFASIKSLLEKLLWWELWMNLRRYWAHWRIPSPPIVERLCLISLCKLRALWEPYERFSKSEQKTLQHYVFQSKVFASIKSLLEKWLWWEFSMNLRRPWGHLADPVIANSEKIVCDFFMYIESPMTMRDLAKVKQALRFPVKNFRFN